jgi:Na+/proline symporter
VALSVNALLGPETLGQLHVPDTALIIALAMGMFAILFGTRHIDATEHQEGLIVAVAAESLVKLAAFLTVGFFVMFSVFGGIGDFVNSINAEAELHKIFAQGLHGGTWVTVTFLSLVCIVLLPRQFHVTVVENNSERELQRAAWLFPVYLVLINLFVVPIAAAGLMGLPKGLFDADTFVLALPLSKGAEAITLLAFVGGLSAATAMVIVDSVALAIMVCNGLVLPLLLRHRSNEAGGQQQDMTRLLLTIRRVAIFGIVLLGYLFYRLLGQTHGLASIGLVSFAAIAQFAPAFFGGLIWRKATARGAIAGTVIGFAVWAYTLLLPWIIEAGWIPRSVLIEGPFGVGFLSPQALFYLKFEPLTHGVLWSIAANLCTFISVSLLKAPLTLTVAPPGRVTCPWPPAALALKFVRQETELVGNPLTTVVRIRFGSPVPLLAARAVITAPGEGASQQAFALALVRARLVTRVKSLPVVMITYTWLSCDKQRWTEIAELGAALIQLTTTANNTPGRYTPIGDRRTMEFPSPRTWLEVQTAATKRL